MFTYKTKKCLHITYSSLHNLCIPLFTYSYDDYLALKVELKYSCYGFIAVILVLLIFFAIVNSVQALSSTPYVSLILWHICVFWNFSMMTLSSHWVVKKFDPVLRRHRHSDASLFSDVNRVQKKNGDKWLRSGEKNKKRNNGFTNGNNNRQDSSQQIHQNKAIYKLQQILKHPKAYDLFMHHLWKEHSSECLLSSTEFIQFQYLIIYHHEAMNINTNQNCISELDDTDINQLSPEIPQSSIVFGQNPTNKISVYIHNKLNPSFEPDYQHKKSIMGINTALVGVARNLANAISPSQSKSKGHYESRLHAAANAGGNNRPILGGSHPQRIRHSISGKLGFKIKKGPKPKKVVHRKRHSLSSNKPQLTQKRSKEDQHIPQSQSHSAFQLKLDINTSNLVQAFEPLGSPPITSNEDFYKKPVAPNRPPPALPTPTHLHQQVSDSDSKTLSDNNISSTQIPLPPPVGYHMNNNNNNNNNNTKFKLNIFPKQNDIKLQLNQIKQQRMEPPSFKPLPSHSELEKTRSSDTDLDLDDVDDDYNEGSVVINDNAKHIYSGVPITSDNDITPTMRSQYIDPNEPPLPPLKPLPEPPSPKDKESDNNNFDNRNFKSSNGIKIKYNKNKKLPKVTHIAIKKSQSLPPEPVSSVSPRSPVGQIVANNNHFRGIKSEDYIDTTHDPMIMNESNKEEQDKSKRTHKRTLSLRDRLNGLVQSTSLRKLPFSKSNSDLSKGSNGQHRRTQSGRLNPVFNDDDDSLSSSENEEKSMEPEDSVIAEYKSMNAEELYSKKLELIMKYREIAYELWIKYIKVGAEYEINIDFTTRKRFAKLMNNKQEWLNNKDFNEKELHLLFYPCTQRMFTFLSNSFTRFRDKPDFDRVQEFLII